MKHTGSIYCTSSLCLRFYNSKTKPLCGNKTWFQARNWRVRLKSPAFLHKLFFFFINTHAVVFNWINSPGACVRALLFVRAGEMNKSKVTIQVNKMWLVIVCLNRGSNKQIIHFQWNSGQDTTKQLQINNLDWYVLAITILLFLFFSNNVRKFICG